MKLETTESKWEVELDVAKFKPEDLKVLSCNLKMDFNQTTAGSQGFQCVKVSVDTFS